MKEDRKRIERGSKEDQKRIERGSKEDRKRIERGSKEDRNRIKRELIEIQVRFVLNNNNNCGTEFQMAQMHILFISAV